MRHHAEFHLAAVRSALGSVRDPAPLSIPEDDWS
jgi:hypothetical protein